MKTKDDCIFCKIVAGSIPAVKVFENAEILAFMDIAPLNKGHLLVIPKEHAENIHEIDPDSYGRLYAVAAGIAEAVGNALKPDGLNIMQLNGKAGNQVVPHVHVHLVPRWFGDELTICNWNPIQGDIDEIKQIAELIRKHV